MRKLKYVSIKQIILILLLLTFSKPGYSCENAVTGDRKDKIHAMAKRIRTLLSGINGIEVCIIENRVNVSGQVELPRDQNRILSVVRGYEFAVDANVDVSPDSMKKIAASISKDINNPEIQVIAKNGKIVLQGLVVSEDEKLRAEVIAKVYIPPALTELAIDPRKPANFAQTGIVNLIDIKE